MEYSPTVPFRSHHYNSFIHWSIIIYLRKQQVANVVFPCGKANKVVFGVLSTF